MPRGRKRGTEHPLPPGGYYKVTVRATELMRDGLISARDFALYCVLSMFAWDWQKGCIKVTEAELSRWLGVSREWVSKRLKRLMEAGLIQKTEEGISVNCNSCELSSSPPPNTPPNNRVVVNNQDTKLPPPPNLYLSNAPERELQFTQIPKSVNYGSQMALVNLALEIGIRRHAGLLALLESGLGPRRLWTWWKQIQSSGGGVGAFVAAVMEGNVLAPPLSRHYSGPDFCPECGAKLSGVLYKSPDECLNCGTRLRVCECGELAPQGQACLWCGALEISTEEVSYGEGDIE